MLKNCKVLLSIKLSSNKHFEWIGLSWVTRIKTDIKKTKKNIWSGSGTL